MDANKTAVVPLHDSPIKVRMKAMNSSDSENTSSLDNSEVHYYSLKNVKIRLNCIFN